MNIKLATVVAFSAMSLAALAQRAPTVTYTVSGSAGAWDLNFEVQNNFLSGEGSVYFFGVDLATGGNIQSSPGIWDPGTWPTWDNTAYGGSSQVYNNNWIDQSFTDMIAEGTSRNGFIARSTDAVAPTAVNYFMYMFEGTYGGNDNFNNSTNPGFEGRATVAPEPASMAVLGLGAAAMLRRRKKKSA